ncbi:DMT family transporter [Leucobacter musarum]|uniref:DMT family transporter n=1 Tax=Leucobacter musarum TaxID=1930747 RepID=UPI0006A7D1BC|nr:SMR family transporter [Leucobacter musarum]
MSRAWLFLAGAIALEVTGSMSLKAALDHPALYIVVAVGYVGSFVCLGKVLSLGMALGVAYGIWGATGVALTASLSTVIFHEPFTALMGAGIVLIIGGVLLVELGSQAAHRKAARAAADAARADAAGADSGEGAAA